MHRLTRTDWFDIGMLAETLGIGPKIHWKVHGHVICLVTWSYIDLHYDIVVYIFKHIWLYNGQAHNLHRWTNMHLVECLLLSEISPHIRKLSIKPMIMIAHSPDSKLHPSTSTDIIFAVPTSVEIWWPQESGWPGGIHDIRIQEHLRRTWPTLWKPWTFCGASGPRGGPWLPWCTKNLIQLCMSE